jgi:uncharacterized protein (DUF58 family)
MAQRNDVLAIPVFDPASQELPEAGRLVVGDGELQMEIDFGTGKARTRLLELAQGRLAAVVSWQNEIGVPALPVSCGEDEMAQVRRLLGRAARGGRPGR